MRQQESGQEVVAKEDQGSPAPLQKEFTTKAEHNRWLLTQEKHAVAEQTRQDAKSGSELVKERQRQHATQGLSRQQAAAVQMKKASESVEAHRESNLSLGKAVYEEVAGCRKGASETKEMWASLGKSIREAQKEANAVPAAMEALSVSKKAQAKTTRDDDLKVEQTRKEEAEAHLERQRKQAEMVRKATADAVTDDAKRLFYEQRLKSAAATKTDAARWEKERKEEESAFREVQKRRRQKSKLVRAAATKSRQALLTARAEDASAMRAEKKRLIEQNRERQDDDRRERTAQVKGVQANAFLQPMPEPPPPSSASPRATGSPLSSPGKEGGTKEELTLYSLTNIRPVSPVRGEEGAAAVS